LRSIGDVLAEGSRLGIRSRNDGFGMISQLGAAVGKIGRIQQV
jgi:hypothetical protein